MCFTGLAKVDRDGEPLPDTEGYEEYGLEGYALCVKPSICANKY